jgi:hypothetical protein
MDIGSLPCEDAGSSPTTALASTPSKDAALPFAGSPSAAPVQVGSPPILGQSATKGNLSVPSCAAVLPVQIDALRSAGGLNPAAAAWVPSAPPNSTAIATAPTDGTLATAIDLLNTLITHAADLGLLRPLKQLGRPNTHLPYSVFDPLDSPAVKSPLHPVQWQALLQSYPDRSFVNAILGMIDHGAKLGYKGIWSNADRPSSGRNLPMNDLELSHVRTTVASRVEAGYS